MPVETAKATQPAVAVAAEAEAAVATAEVTPYVYIS
jgi:hypothetical protein